jgi:hypothetical protein
MRLGLISVGRSEVFHKVNLQPGKLLTVEASFRDKSALRTVSLIRGAAPQELNFVG